MALGLRPPKRNNFEQIYTSTHNDNRPYAWCAELYVYKTGSVQKLGKAQNSRSCTVLAISLSVVASVTWSWWYIHYWSLVSISAANWGMFSWRWEGPPHPPINTNSVATLVTTGLLSLVVTNLLSVASYSIVADSVLSHTTSINQSYRFILFFYWHTET